MMKNLIFYLSLSFVWLVAGCSEKDKSGNYSNGVNPESIYDVQAYTLNDSSL